MSEKSNMTSGGGLGCGTVLFFIFLTLKLCDKIDWSWWWVTAPLWIPLVLLAIFVAFCLIMAVIFNRS